jgi:hypothetical protein
MTTVLDEVEAITWRNIREKGFYLEIPEPVRIGPVWTKDSFGLYVAPEHTLGWQAIRWVEANLLNDEGGPFVLTDEQKRLLLWWYAVDEHGRFVYRKSVIQRLKGWGKDPFAAIISAIEFVGPCRFGGWLNKDRFDLGLRRGDPLGVEHPRAWIQIAAVSMDQTRNTMKLFPGLFSPKCKEEHGIDIGKTVIYAHAGQRTIEAVTSSPAALEGGRPTFTLKNETHHWKLNNEGHGMSAVITRNAAKAKNGASRTMSITNAYEPSEDSVAQREREAWEDERDGLAVPTGVLYDSVEAAENAYIYLPDKPDGTKPTHAEIRAYVGAVIDSVRGDAWWLDVDSLLDVIFDRSNPLSESRRFYFNQIVTSEDAWLHADALKLLPHPMAREQRAGDTSEESPLMVSWSLVHPDEEVVVFFDGSKSQDSTGLVGCRLSDGYVFLIGVWQRPRGERGDRWLAPREAVDARVIEVMGWGMDDDGVDKGTGRFNVVAFFGDPSHALDDDDSTRYWDGIMDRWHRRYKHRLQVWATKTGNRQHSVLWDMSSPTNQQEFVSAVERCRGEIQHLNDIEAFEPEFHTCGHPALMQHLRNAKEYPTKYGMSIWKGAREADKKIDLAVCTVGARMLRRMMLNVGVEDEEVVAQEIWGRWSGLSVDQYSEGRW